MSILDIATVRCWVFLAICILLSVVSVNSLAEDQLIHASFNNDSKKLISQPILLAYNRNSDLRYSSQHFDKTKKYKYLVERTKVKETEYANAVLKVMLREIDITLGRDDLKEKLEEATPGQRAIYAVYHLHNEVSTGGFTAYFVNGAGNLVPEARLALKLIGANQYLALLKKALYVFADDEEMLDDATDRQEVINRLSSDEKFAAFEEIDADFESLENDNMLYEHISRYIEDHPEHFFKD